MLQTDSFTHAVILWLLTFLFFLRVLGQILVAFFKVNVLPSMPHWYSGLLPYPLLLTSQILILMLQVKINVDLSVGSSFFAVPRPSFGEFLRWFSYFYAIGMAIRYIVTMSRYPDRRWLGKGTIPTIFHFVLAGYLFTWGHFYTMTD